MRPLEHTVISLEVTVNLIANTTPDSGLHVEAALDLNPYETGKKVSDEELAQVNLYPAKFHGNDWNYVIKPRYKYR
jgi:hypothetical protein